MCYNMLRTNVRDSKNTQEDADMTREELLELARRTPDVGMAKHSDYIDYLVPVETTRQTRGEWTTINNAYMTVVGKVAMANQDHRAQGKRLNFEDPVILVDNDEQLTLMVVIDSEAYGRRHGIATSRRVDGSAVEREYPWEVAETSAMGRALTAMGYGALAGAGLASAEDMQRATQAAEGPKEERPAPRLTITDNSTRYKPAAVVGNKRVSKVSRYQHDKLVELYREVYGADDETAEAGVDAMFQQQFGHGLDEASYNEGAHITARLLAQQRQARGAVAAAS
jgi:hypothetical protein